MAIEFPIFHSAGRWRVSVPLARIEKNGIGLNIAACQLFELSDRPLVLLGYDRETQTVVIKFLSEWQKGARTLSMHKNITCGVIGCKQFLQHFGLRPKTGIRITQVKDTLQFVYPSDSEGK